jgi:hypothetical protein
MEACIMRRVLAASLVLVSFVTACVTPADQKFIGKTSAQLEAEMGSPNERIPDRRGGEIWKYKVRRQLGPSIEESQTHPIAGAYNTTDKNTSWMLSPSPRETTLRSFYLNTDGIVYRSRED